MLVVLLAKQVCYSEKTCSNPLAPGNEQYMREKGELPHLAPNAGFIPMYPWHLVAKFLT